MIDLSSQRPVLSVFYSYSHTDSHLTQQLIKALEPLGSHASFEIRHWYDGLILAGSDWEREIRQQIRQANVVLLLLSPKFIDSHFCYDKELEWALQQHLENRALVVPVILKEVPWRDKKFSPLQAIPRRSRASDPVAIKDWRSRGQAWEALRDQLASAITQYVQPGLLIDSFQECGHMQDVSNEDLSRAAASASSLTAVFESPSDFWEFRAKLAEDDLIKVTGTFSDFAPLFPGHPTAKRQLHLEFRKALQSSKRLARKKMTSINACMSISAGQMVWRRRRSSSPTVACGLYESIVRNSIPLYVQSEYYEQKLRPLIVTKQQDTFEADVVGQVLRRDASGVARYMRKHGMDAFIPEAVIQDLSRDVIGLSIGSEGTGITYRAKPRYLDGDIWVAAEDRGREFLVTRFLNIASRKDRESETQSLRAELDQYRGLPRLIGQFDDIDELVGFGFSVATEGPAEEIFRFGLGARN